MSVRKITGALVAALGFGLAMPTSLPAQGLQSLELGRIGYIQPGNYLAGDRIAFDLSPSGSDYLMRLQGSREVFVLYVDAGTLGGRILKYDSGETALRVTGWGGLTLYTDDAPGGLPAVRMGEAGTISLPSISMSDMQNAANDEAERLAYVRRLNVQFTADWGALSDNPALRGLAFDAMENAVRGIERFCQNPASCANFSRRIGAVTVATGWRPTLSINGRTLIVTFNSGQGFAGRASSRAIAHALGNILR